MVMSKVVVPCAIHEMYSIVGVIQNPVVFNRVTCACTYNSESISAASLNFVVRSFRIAHKAPSHAKPEVVEDSVVVYS